MPLFNPLPPTGPGAGTYAYPSSVSLDAQGRVTALGGNWTVAGYTMTGNITLANAANAIQSGTNQSIQMTSGQANGSPAYAFDTTTIFNNSWIYDFKTGGQNFFRIYANPNGAGASVPQLAFFRTDTGVHVGSLVGYLSRLTVYAFSEFSAETDGVTNLGGPGRGFSGLNITKNTIGTTQDQTIYLQNKSAAANGAQQYSPSVVWEGQGWNTGTGASEALSWLTQLRPVQQAGGSAHQELVFYASGGGSYTERMKLADPGWLKVTGSNSGFTPTAWFSDANSSLGGAVYVEWRSGAVNNKVHLMAADGNGLSFYRMQDGGGAYFVTTPDLSIDPTGVVKILTSGTLVNTTNYGLQVATGGAFVGAFGTSTGQTGYQLLLANTSAAANNAQQYSLPLDLQGRGWDNIAGNSVTVDWVLQNRPVQGSPPTEDFVWWSSIGGAAFSEVLALSSGGNLRAPTTNVATLGDSSHLYKQVWAYQHNGVVQTTSTSGAVTVDPTAGELAKITATGNITSLTISLGQPAQILTLILVNPAGGASWPTTITNAILTGGLLTKTTGGGAVDSYTFRYDSNSSKWREIGRSQNQS